MRKTIPIYADDGAFQLWDMYIDGLWHGSRRTIEQCALYFGTWRFAINPTSF